MPVTDVSSNEVEKIEILSSSEFETSQISEIVAANLKIGDIVGLTGNLGAGKSIFARSLIRRLLNQSELEITSPTFMVVEEYSDINFNVIHADLYRLSSPNEFDELGIIDSLSSSITIVEWPERIPSFVEYVDIHISFQFIVGENESFRKILISLKQDKFSKLRAELNAFSFLTKLHWQSAPRQIIAGDASNRHFERIITPSKSAILMYSPRPNYRALGITTYEYRKSAKLSDDLDDFLAISKGLNHFGFSAPQIISHDPAKFLALIEDFGDDKIYTDIGPIKSRYQVATEFLVKFHTSQLPRTITYEPGRSYQLPIYDLTAFLVETNLFLDWFFQYFESGSLPESARTEFLDIWRQLLTGALKDRHGWVLRDFHSVNIVWLEERPDIRKIGLLDFQDMVWGPQAYDLASLLMDARIPIDNEIGGELFDFYLKRRSALDVDFDPESFKLAYSVFGLQRIFKIFGIFVRLNQRDHKSEYLRLIPQLFIYARSCLDQNIFHELRSWLKAYCPNFSLKVL